MATRSRSSAGKALSRTVEGVDLVGERRAGEIVADGALPLGATAGGPAAVGDHDGEALVREPLRRQVGVVVGRDPLRMRAAVRVEQDGESGVVVGVPPARQEDRRCEITFTGGHQDDVGCDRRGLDVRCDGGAVEEAVDEDGRGRAGCVEADGPDHDGRSADHRPSAVPEPR